METTDELMRYQRPTSVHVRKNDFQPVNCRLSRMSMKLENRKVLIRLSDPWDLGEQLGWAELEAEIILVKYLKDVPISLVTKLVNPFEYKTTRCEYFVASPRHEENEFDRLVQNQAVFCGLTRIDTDQTTAADPFDLSNLRGGIGLIGEIELTCQSGPLIP